MLSQLMSGDCCSPRVTGMILRSWLSSVGAASSPRVTGMILKALMNGDLGPCSPRVTGMIRILRRCVS